MNCLLLFVIVVSVGAHEGKLPQNPKWTENGEYLWQGDMILNAEQVESMMNPVNMRKAIADERYRWTNGVVPFYITESSMGDRDIILSGLQHWMDNMCVTFVEVEEGYPHPHLIFKKTPDGCYSAVGMHWWENGQDVSIGYRCEYMGTVAHEVGHALGFYHEHSRPDRDQYIIVLKENAKEKYWGFFDVFWDTKTYNIPYDFTSIMQYESMAMSKNGKPTLVPKDVTKAFDIQSEKKLSFYDLKMASIMYKCDAKCTYKPNCLNEGFVDHHCKCRCPDEYQGDFCERYVGIPGKCGGKFWSPVNITSPNYPREYTMGSKCVWAFQAPEGKRVKVFFPEFELNPRDDPGKVCSLTYLEVRHTSLYDQGVYEGYKYCGTELKNRDLKSIGNTLALLFKADASWWPGFQVVVTFV